MIANITKKNAIVLFEEREREFNGIWWNNIYN
jgi:hypothetical protein